MDYGLPTMATLMYELASFARGEGSPIDSKLRRMLPNLRFTFDKFAGDRGDALLAQLFEGDADLAAKLRSAAGKLQAAPGMDSLVPVVQQLCDMADSNQLSGPALEGLAGLAGETGQLGSIEPLLDPQKLSLSHVAGSALRQGFQQVLRRGLDLTEEERDALELFVVATSNVEQLLSLYFARYQDGSAADRKNYLYLAWIFWAFLRVRSSGLGPRESSIYRRLPGIGADVITFNYTNFFESSMLSRVKFFHGRLDRYLRLDTRDLVTDDPRLRAAVDVDRVVAFIDALRLDVGEDPAIDVPAIVPPTTFKPVMSRDQLRVWVEADDMLQKASVVVVVGYSFGLADEHFNDLVRKTHEQTRVVIVNPNLEASVDLGSRLLGVDPGSLVRSQTEGHHVFRSQRLTCAGARASDVTSDFLGVVLAPN